MAAFRSDPDDPGRGQQFHRGSVQRGSDAGRVGDGLLRRDLYANESPPDLWGDIFSGTRAPSQTDAHHRATHRRISTRLGRRDLAGDADDWPAGFPLHVAHLRIHGRPRFGTDCGRPGSDSICGAATQRRTRAAVRCRRGRQNSILGRTRLPLDSGPGEQRDSPSHHGARSELASVGSDLLHALMCGRLRSSGGIGGGPAGCHRRHLARRALSKASTAHGNGRRPGSSGTEGPARKGFRKI